MLSNFHPGWPNQIRRRAVLSCPPALRRHGLVASTLMRRLWLTTPACPTGSVLKARRPLASLAQYQIGSVAHVMLRRPPPLTPVPPTGSALKARRPLASLVQYRIGL